MKKNINVFLKNGFEKEIVVQSGTIINDLLDHIKDDEQYIAAKVNNEITSLSYSLNVNSTVEFISKFDHYGMEVYRRSLSFLLEKVAIGLFPERRLIIGHSLGPGYYFDLEGMQLLEIDVKKIEQEMKKEVTLNKEIKREKISYKDALEHFKKNNRLDKYNLMITGLNAPKLSIYRCDDFFQVFDLPLVNNTSVLNVFSLIYYPPGFILQFPKKSDPDLPAQFKEQRKIFDVYQEQKHLGKILKVDNVSALNKIILSNQISEFIQIDEALHAKRIMHLSGEVYELKDSVRLVCIAGPSSSDPNCRSGSR